jgi:hypothetical protein
MTDITIDRSVTSGTAFRPDPFPSSGSVQQGTTVTFASADPYRVIFYAQAGLFSLPGGGTNTSNTAFVAPGAGSTPLSLTIALVAVGQLPFTLSLSPGCPLDGGDGTINVGSKGDDDPEVRVVRPPATLRPAPPDAMYARDSD